MVVQVRRRHGQGPECPRRTAAGRLSFIESASRTEELLGGIALVQTSPVTESSGQANEPARRKSPACDSGEKRLLSGVAPGVCVSAAVTGTACGKGSRKEVPLPHHRRRNPKQPSDINKNGTVMTPRCC